MTLISLHPHHPQLEMLNGNNEEGTSQERPGIRYGDFGFSSAYDSPLLFFLLSLPPPSSFLSSFPLHPFPLLSLSLQFLFLFPLSIPLPLHTIILSFLHLSSLSLAKHPSHNHAVPGFLLGFGKHRDKFVAETCLYPL